MNLKRSEVKRKLKEGKVCFGTMLRILKSPQAVSMCASEGWDYVILGNEHNDYNQETVGAFSAIAKYEQMGLFMRVADKQYHLMAQALDIGVEGLICANVKTKEEAEFIVQSTKYAPVGKRGVSISMTTTQYRDYGVVEYTNWANDELMNIIQIESEEGVNNIDQILSVQGIDAIMMGPADLSQDMGIPGQLSHPQMEDAYREVIRSANEHGVAPGVHFADMNLVRKWVSEGMRFVTYNYDTKIFKDASRYMLGELHDLVNQ